MEPYFTTQGITILAATVVAAGILIAGELFLLQFFIAIPLLPFRLLAALFHRRRLPEDSDLEPDPNTDPEETDESESRPTNRTKPTRPPRQSLQSGGFDPFEAGPADQGQSADRGQVAGGSGPRAPRIGKRRRAE